MPPDEPSGIRRLPYKRPPRDQLRRAAQQETPTEPLHLVHVTELGYADEIVRSGQMATRRCSVFELPLLYTYIGRPAFRLRDGDQRHNSSARYPFAFLIAPDKLPRPYQVFPFDTGAGHNGIFGNVANPEHVFMEDYALENDLAAAHRHIAWAFGTNREYFQGSLRSGLDSTLGQMEWVLRAFVAIARQGNRSSNTATDMRASSVEVAFNTHLDVRGNVKFVVLPQQIILDSSTEAKEFLGRLSAMGIAYGTYNWDPTWTPDQHMDEVTRLVERYLFSQDTPAP
jgi:hypothetical protein